jgi:hypothetical protein
VNFEFSDQALPPRDQARGDIRVDQDEPFNQIPTGRC